MATYRKVSRLVPSFERTAQITDVAPGDRIDIKDILGRPARQIKIIPFNSADIIHIRLNNKLTIERPYGKSGNPEAGENQPNPVVIVSTGEQFPVYELSGEAVYYTEDGVFTSFIEI